MDIKIYILYHESQLEFKRLLGLTMITEYPIPLCPCGKRKFTGYAHGGTMVVYFRAEHCRAEHFRVDGKEAGGAVCPGTSPQNRPGIAKHNRTKKTVIAYMGGCGLFSSGKTKGARNHE